VEGVELESNILRGSRRANFAVNRRRARRKLPRTQCQPWKHCGQDVLTFEHDQFRPEAGMSPTPELIMRRDTEKPPIFILPIDQGEELFLAEGAEEAERLLALVHDLLTDDAPGVLALITMRSDSYERLQSAKSLDGIAQATLSLPPMARGAYQG